MSFLKIPNVSIKGVSASVPRQKVSNKDYAFLSEKEKEFITKNIGIHSRRIASDNTTASDLCFYAANKLVQELNWNLEDINILVFISQTPDYITPCTAAILQDRLGLSKHCLAFDINLGCSALPYGLSVVASLLQNIPNGKALLLIGDKSSQLVSEEDKSTALLFSDAGSATALANENQAKPMWFSLGTDGSGADAIMVKGGGARFPFHKDALIKQKFGDGVLRHELNLSMKGLDVFKFAVTQVPKSIKNLLTNANVLITDIDYFVLHQANKLINKTIGKKLGIPEKKLPETLQHFGNSSSASIPVTLVAGEGLKLSEGHHLLVLSGFGVGLSWGTAIVHFHNVKILPLVEMD